MAGGSDVQRSGFPRGSSRVHPRDASAHSHLAMTAALWRGIAEELAAWIVRSFTSGKPARLILRDVWIQTEAKRRADRWRLGNTLQRPIPAMCAECGKALPNKRRKFCSDDSVRVWHGGSSVTAATIAARAARRQRLAQGEPVAK